MSAFTLMNFLLILKAVLGCLVIGHNVFSNWAWTLSCKHLQDTYSKDVCLVMYRATVNISFITLKMHWINGKVSGIWARPSTKTWIIVAL